MYNQTTIPTQLSELCQNTGAVPYGTRGKLAHGDATEVAGAPVPNFSGVWESLPWRVFMKRLMPGKVVLATSLIGAVLLAATGLAGNAAAQGTSATSHRSEACCAVHAPHNQQMGAD